MQNPIGLENSQHLYRYFTLIFDSKNCIKCIRIIEVIHRLNNSMDRIKSHYNSDLYLLKNTEKIAMSDLLDIIAR